MVLYIYKHFEIGFSETISWVFWNFYQNSCVFGIIIANNMKFLFVKDENWFFFCFFENTLTYAIDIYLSRVTIKIKELYMNIIDIIKTMDHSEETTKLIDSQLRKYVSKFKKQGDIDDLLQEAWVYVLEEWDSIKYGVLEEGYVILRLKARLSSYLDKNKITAPPSDNIEDYRGTGPSVKDFIDEYLSISTDAIRDVYRYVYVMGYTHQKTSDIMGVKRHQVRDINNTIKENLTIFLEE